MSSQVSHPDCEVQAPSRHGPLEFLLGRPLLLGILLVVATVALYYPVDSHPFVKYDDNEYVFENPHVRSGLNPQTIAWAFTTSTASNWHPLTWLSHSLDCQLFGLNPAGHHDVNLLLHAVNVALLFWMLLSATGFAGRSFMVAALFALHPINVETVVWIAERKNVLSALFFLLALAAYRWYAREPRAGRYVVVAFLFVLGLMAKPQVITLPFVLLLWDYWPLRRMFAADREAGSPLTANPIPPKSLSWLIKEKLPLLAIAAASAVITMKVQHGARSWFPRLARGGNAILSYALYVKKALWPSGLAPLYPHPGASINWWSVLAAAFFLLAITALVLAGRRYRYLPVGWFWFLGSLVPMLGIVQVGVQAMADRYAYTSFLGLFLMICWGVADWAQKKRVSAMLLPLASMAVLLALTVVARRQIDYWQTDEILWTHALQVTAPNWVAEGQLGAALAMNGRVEDALPHFSRAVAINPIDTTGNLGIAIYDLQRGNFAEALVYYKKVVAMERQKPSILVQSYMGMAKAYRALGDTTNSQASLQAARKLQNQ